MQKVYESGRPSLALVALLLFLVVPTVLAQESSPFDPPESRVRPPVGLTDESRVRPPVGVRGGTSSQARVQPPVVVPAKVQPTLFEVFLAWLQTRTIG